MDDDVTEKTAEFFCIFADYKPVTHWAHKPVTELRPRPDIMGVCKDHGHDRADHGYVVVPISAYPKYDPVKIAANREWAQVGEDYIVKAYAEGVGRYHGEYDQERMRGRIQAEIAGLTWQPAEGSMPFSPGMLLQEVVKQMELPNVAAVALDGYLTLPDGPETGTYAVLGIETNLPAPMNRTRIYMLDCGSSAVTLAVDSDVPTAALA